MRWLEVRRGADPGRELGLLQWASNLRNGKVVARNQAGWRRRAGIDRRCIFRVGTDKTRGRRTFRMNVLRCDDLARQDDHGKQCN